MEIKVPKYIRWVALVLYRSRVDAMNLVGVPKSMQKAAYGALAFILLGGTVTAYIISQLEQIPY